jgi:hypothetical protein
MRAGVRARMDGQDNPDAPALIRGAAQSPIDRARSLDLFLARCWPGGGDRYEPAGRAWGPPRAAPRHTDLLRAAARAGAAAAAIEAGGEDRSTRSRPSMYVQGIDNAEIIDTFHGRRAPTIPRQHAPGHAGSPTTWPRRRLRAVWPTPSAKEYARWIDGPNAAKHARGA